MEKKSDNDSVNNKVEVRIANLYQYSQMSSLGNAENMLLKQFQFPFVFEQDKDKITTAYLDRIRGWWPEDSEVCLKKFNLEGWGIEDKLRGMEDNKILDFLCEIMKVERDKYTGYRIICGVGGNGHPYFCFQLFSKHPESETEVFSGENAPNVQKRDFFSH